MYSFRKSIEARLSLCVLQWNDPYIYYFNLLVLLNLPPLPSNIENKIKKAYTNQLVKNERAKTDTFKIKRANQRKESRKTGKQVKTDHKYASEQNTESNNKVNMNLKLKSKKENSMVFSQNLNNVESDNDFYNEEGEEDYDNESIYDDESSYDDFLSSDSDCAFPDDTPVSVIEEHFNKLKITEEEIQEIEYYIPKNVGIKQEGNSCYITVVLQSLIHNIYFIDIMTNDIVKQKIIQSMDTSEYKLLINLYKLINTVNKTNLNYVDGSCVTHLFPYRIMDDANLFYGRIINMLSEEFIMLGDDRIIDLFHWKIYVSYKSKCVHEIAISNLSDEHFYRLDVHKTEPISLLELINENLTMDDGSKMKCAECNKKVPMVSQNSVIHIPISPIFYFMRKWKATRNNTRINLPISFPAQVLNTAQQYNYSLNGVICYNMPLKHYTYAKFIEGKIIIYDGSNVTEYTESENSLSKIEERIFRECYMAIYNEEK
ncbi:hypothetical protein TRFO_24988 [Tritrichomonas foetus]|uniref:ubiquitinyl hydrolase 1 n=1 Tax=Tritrichomonas foetus TaxID=1144522 RepID=A0A1J4KBN4_9EUKA|nr:hypothetical protein TRFO_24988 [Tritrichomonas foetus]|eukprot:OHT06885.1 hypothetical protein TRFO_24988 [Tritrichomonas foetus]